MAGTGFEAGDAERIPRIVRTDDVLGGEPRIEGRRIGVHHVYRDYVDGDEPPESIAASYDLDLGEVHAALAYAFSNPQEMRRIEARQRERFQERDHVTPDDVE